MISRLLSAVRARKVKSSYEVLKRFVPAREYRKLAMATPDRRHLFAVAAALLGSTEFELMQKIGSQIGLFVVEHPVAMDLNHLAGCTMADLRSAAVVGLSGPEGLVGCVCLDPAQVTQLPASVAKLPRYLGTWSGIARALDESERLWQAREAERQRKQGAVNRDMVEGVLGIVIADTLQFGAARLEIDCSQEDPIYRFRAADGRTGTGSLNPQLRGVLREYCEQLSDAGVEGRIRLPSGQNFDCMVGRTIVQGVYLIEERGGSTRLDTTAKSRGSHTEAPVLHTIDGGKAERRTMSQSSDPSMGINRKSAKARRPRVLVLDDNEVFANVLERFLGRMEIEVIYQSDGGQITQRLKESEADLLICDVHMPSVPGFEVVRIVRESDEYQDIPIVMLTSDSDIETEVRLLNGGADAFVSKSDDPRKLCAHVHRLLVRAGKRKEAA